LAQQKGFLGLDKYRCLEENILYLMADWESIEDFEACRRTPQWLVLMPDWSDLQEEESVMLTYKYCESF
ncbi:antibiotic biosynthesis monooxygenase family protein, partial [Planctomycetota bacterium]